MGKKSTFHAKNGKFTSYDHANIVNNGGKKFRMVRTLEPVDAKSDAAPAADAPAPDAGATESVNRVKAKIRALEGRIAPQWLPLSEVIQESRPGSHWNPWPQKVTRTAEFVKSLEDMARVNQMVDMWSKKTADMVASVALYVKKGDKVKVKKLQKMLVQQGEVSQGLINEIEHWLMGWMDG